MRPAGPKVRQPASFEQFRCIGAACEDTCCAGWGVPVDRQTYEKFQNLPEQRIANRRLSSLVEINPEGSSSGDYARLRLEDARCPALEANLCSIQQTLGEPYLPDLCSKYPRVLNMIGGAVERSLHLSCPEAARLVLDDPEAMNFEERVDEELSYRAGSLNFFAGDADPLLYAVRVSIADCIRRRFLPLGQRIVSLERLVDKLAGVELAAAEGVIKDYLRGDATEENPRGDSAFQLKTVMELVIARISSDYTAPRFIECYKDFLHGLEWTPQRPMEELVASYDFSRERYLQPLLARHPHLLENYLLHYIFRTVFPYRSKLPGRKFAIDSSRESMSHAFVILALHYAMLRTILIGMAAQYKESLSVSLVIKLVQSYSKAFLHCSSFEISAIEYLGKNAAGPVARLVMD